MMTEENLFLKHPISNLRPKPHSLIVSYQHGTEGFLKSCFSGVSCKSWSTNSNIINNVLTRSVERGVPIIVSTTTGVMISPRGCWRRICKCYGRDTQSGCISLRSSDSFSICVLHHTSR